MDQGILFAGFVAAVALIFGMAWLGSHNSQEDCLEFSPSTGECVLTVDDVVADYAHNN